MHAFNPGTLGAEVGSLVYRMSSRSALHGETLSKPPPFPKNNKDILVPKKKRIIVLLLFHFLLNSS